MKTVALVLSVVATMAWAAPQGGYQPPAVVQPQYPDTSLQYSNVPAQYSFQWDVSDSYSGNYYGHQEHRDGDNTEGSYYVHLPDARVMKVTYYVDQYGYHPTITYEGEAQYPSVPDQGYSQPAPGPVFVQSTPAPFLPSPSPSPFYSQPGK